MGLSHVVAAAVLWTGVAVVTFDYVGTTFEHETSLDTAWKAAREAEAERLATAISITSVNRQGQSVIVGLSNDGTSTLDADSLTLLVDGVPTAITSYSVEGAASTVWPPATDATVQYADNQLPTSLWIATHNGAFAVWRA